MYVYGGRANGKGRGEGGRGGVVDWCGVGVGVGHTTLARVGPTLSIRNFFWRFSVGHFYSPCALFFTTSLCLLYLFFFACDILKSCCDLFIPTLVSCLVVTKTSTKLRGATK